jgi:hypothetical protein
MYKRLFYLICSVLMPFAVPCVTQAQVENLVQNPSFEEDEIILNDQSYDHWWTWGWEDGLKPSGHSNGRYQLVFHCRQ